MSKLDDTFAALKADLIHDDGPRISTMRNYRYCIVVYRPKEEYAVRRRVSELHQALTHSGWVVKTISLQALLLRRLEARGDDMLERLIAREKAAHRRSPARALGVLQQRIVPELEGPDGLAADVVAEIDTFVAENPDKAERTLVLLGNAGGLYPFFSASALLKHIDGRTHQVPVVMLYPGVREHTNSLSFMGRVPAHTDYRPRIYG